MKTCTKCGIEQPLSAFSQNNKTKDGLTKWCKNCCAQSQQKWYERNKAKRLEQCRIWAENNRARKQAAAKIWEENHKEERREQKQGDVYKAYRHTYYQANKEILREKNKTWGEQNREKRREYSRAWNKRNPTYMYGLTLDEYTAMLEAQGGVCAICQQPEKFILRGKIKRLSVDHDHVTGQIRGLLCGRCNSGIGYFEEDADRMTRAMEYLQRAVKQRKIVQLEMFR